MSEFKFTREERQILYDRELWKEDIDAIEQIISARGESDGWVRVEDGLPLDGQYVLAYTYSTIHSATNEIISEYSEKYGFTSAANVTHWQPLPSPPKPDQQ